MKNNVNVKFGNQIKYKNTCHILFEAAETVNSLCLDTVHVATALASSLHIW